MSNLLPSLMINPGSGIFIGDIFGFILALPISLFLAFWMCSVKNKVAVVVGSFVGTLLGFLIILGWVGTLIFSTPLPGANGAAVFFGSLLFCSICGLAAAILIDLIVARMSSRDYRRQQAAHESEA